MKVKCCVCANRQHRKEQRNYKLEYYIRYLKKNNTKDYVQRERVVKKKREYIKTFSYV